MLTPYGDPVGEETITMLTCSKCGTKNADNAQFCMKCGDSLSGRGFTGGTAGREYGSFWLRLVGFIIDAVILGVAGAVLGGVLGNLGAGINFLVSVTYMVGLNANGGTLGKRAVGLRLESDKTGENIGYGAALGRYIVAFASAVVLLIGYLWVIWDDKNQTWHDKAAGSVVVTHAARRERLEPELSEGETRPREDADAALRPPEEMPGDPAQSPFKSRWFWAVAVGVLLVGLVIVGSVVGGGSNTSDGDGQSVLPDSNSTPRPPRPTQAPPYKLALISADCVRPVEGFIECEGFVENLTSQTMENIQAVIIYTDSGGTPLASDSALIDYNPIFAGQQSPWSVIGTWNPRYEKWRIEFKEFFGGTILTNYDAIR